MKLVAKTSTNGLQAKPKPTAPKISPEEEARQGRAKQLEQQAREKQAAEAAEAAAAKEKDAQRQWILQYAEDDSESDIDEEQQEKVISEQHHTLIAGNSHAHVTTSDSVDSRQCSSAFACKPQGSKTHTHKHAVICGESLLLHIEHGLVRCSLCMVLLLSNSLYNKFCARRSTQYARNSMTNPPY